jgi:hypothetical protein
MDRPRPIGVERQDDGRNARDGDFGERIIYSGLLHAVETHVGALPGNGPYTLVWGQIACSERGDFIHTDCHCGQTKYHGRSVLLAAQQVRNLRYGSRILYQRCCTSTDG